VSSPGPDPVEQDSRGILDPWLLRQRVQLTAPVDFVNHNSPIGIRIDQFCAPSALAIPGDRVARPRRAAPCGLTVTATAVN
jgi:hypothetical protein